MGIEKYKKKTTPEKIWLDDEVYVIGRPYTGTAFAGQAARASARYQLELKVAAKEKDYEKQATIKKRIGLEAACLGNNPCIVELGTIDGLKLQGKDIVELLIQEEYQELMNKIDAALDANSPAFAITEEAAIEEGKWLRITFGGGGEQTAESAD